MKSIPVTVELIDGRAWPYISESTPPGHSPIHVVLRWVIEQVNLGNFSSSTDAKGRMTSLMIGAEAAAPVDDADAEAFMERIQRRLLALNFAGLFAKSREEGIEPQWSALSERATNEAAAAGKTNTALHYSLELMETLQRIEELTFVFRAPPVKGRVADDACIPLRPQPGYGRAVPRAYRGRVEGGYKSG